MRKEVLIPIIIGIATALIFFVLQIQVRTISSVVAFIVYGAAGIAILIGLIALTPVWPKKPFVEVKPDGYSLVVKNKGTFATFDISIKVIKDYMNYQTNRVYKGIWQNTTHYETTLMKDGFDTVLLANHADAPTTNPPTMGLAFPYYDMKANKLMFWQSGLWFWTPKEQKSKPLYPEYEFEITINSNPAMPRNFVKNYKVDLEGLHEP